MDIEIISHAQTDRQMDFPDGTSDEENEALDPRIQSELDHLNLASTEINRLENELDEARSKYRSIISETSNRMEVILHDRKRSIQKSREYYKLMGEAKIAQAEALKAARQFQTATTVYKAAKETVALAECRLIEETETTTAAQLTSAWQEMLNHAISKVTVAERDKTKSEQEHKRRAAKFAELETKIQVLEKKFAKSIKKSRPYFELKAELDIKLMQQKQNVNDLQAAIKSNKRKYTDTLKKLERISEEIHQSRHERFWSKVPRMPGVGAETDSVASSLSELGKESLGYESDLESQFDTLSVDKQSLDLQLNLELGGASINPGNDKTPICEETTDLDNVDDVFEAAGGATGGTKETLDQINNNDQPSVSDVSGNNEQSGASGRPKAGAPSVTDTIGATKDIGIMKGNEALKDIPVEQSDNPNNAAGQSVELSGSSDNIANNGAVIQGASDEISNKGQNDTKQLDQGTVSKDNEADKAELVLQNKHEVYSDEQSDSFESCDEANSPIEGDIDKVKRKEISGEFINANEGEQTSTNMAAIQRPSLSGAED